MYLDPVIEPIKAVTNVIDKEESMLQRVETGFLKGIENSFFGMLFKAEVMKSNANAPTALDIAAKRWQATLEDNPAISKMSRDEQKKLYDDKVKQGRENAIASGAREIDLLPYPSFESVKSYLAANKAKLHVTTKKEAPIIQSTSTSTIKKPTITPAHIQQQIKKLGLRKRRTF